MVESSPFPSDIDTYAKRLVASGMPYREVARAGEYALRYGLDALMGDGEKCLGFDEPECGDWNCLNPQHQRLVYNPMGPPDWDELEAL